MPPTPSAGAVPTDPSPGVCHSRYSPFWRSPARRTRTRPSRRSGTSGSGGRGVRRPRHGLNIRDQSDDVGVARSVAMSLGRPLESSLGNPEGSFVGRLEGSFEGSSVGSPDGMP